jgi:phage baseplate assembly protein gpV
MDVLKQDVGVASLGDAMDVPPSNLKDTAVDQGLGTLDNAAEANPAIGTLDAMPTDMGDELSPASFSCGSLDGGLNTVDSGTVQRLCYDFADSASAADFNPEAGTWVVSNGSYNASGPSEQVTCPGGVFAGSGMSASVLARLSALNVRVHAKMTSVTAPDKLLVLRSRPGGNRIELNFVANYTESGVVQGGFLNISELVDCVNTTYLTADSGNAVMIPHAIGQAIVVDVELVGSHLTVLVDGQKVFDDVVPVAIAAGSVGFAVFRDAETQYDDLVVEVLQ